MVKLRKVRDWENMRTFMGAYMLVYAPCVIFLEATHHEPNIKRAPKFELKSCLEIQNCLENKMVI